MDIFPSTDSGIALNFAPVPKEAKLTPMMAQYRQCKGQLPAGTILLFRLGDFYEMFFEDAKEAAGILNVALTKRGDTPMCGIPYHATGSYMAKLLQAGRKVAICDQVETAKPGQLVKREITQIISPGAHFDERMLEGTPMMCGAIGSQPSQRNSPAFSRPTSFYNRRPTTRMGVEWEWRQAFFVAGQAAPDQKDPDTVMLRDALAGKVGTFIQAWTTQDIRTAVYLKEEMMKEGFGTMRLVIDCGAEAWKEPDMLVRTETAVVLPPFPSQGRTTDQALMPLETPKKLAEAGIVFALSAHDGGDASARLDVQAGFAMRGGLSREAALAAVTITPARMLGIDERVGSVEVGKDADLVLWNGEPFEVTSKPVGVLVDGRLVLDPR